MAVAAIAGAAPASGPAELELHPFLSKEPRRRRRRLTSRQIEAMQYVLHLFMEEDLERGMPLEDHIYCEACAGPRPRAGAIPYDEHLLCNRCAAQFEVAQAGGRIASIGQFVRDKRFGEAERYPLPADVAPHSATTDTDDPRA